MKLVTDTFPCPDCYIQPECSETCAKDVRCTTCDRRKHRIGRSEPIGAYLCDNDCPGYREDPYPPHLWPNEWADHAAGHPREDES